MATTTATPAGEAEQELFRQSVAFKIPKNLDGVKEVFAGPDGEINEKALIYVIRAGIKQIGNNRLRQKLTEKDEKGNTKFEPKDGVYDVTELLLEEPARQVLSQREKLERNLTDAGLPSAAIQNMLATYDKEVGTSTEEDGSHFSVNTSEVRVVAQGTGDKRKFIMKSGANEEEEE